MKHTQPSRVFAQAIELLAIERGDILALTAYSAIVGLLYLVLPLAAQALFANVAFGTLMQPVVALAIIVFAVLTFSGVIRLLEQVVVEKMQRRYFARLTQALAASLNQKETAATDRAEAVDRANRFFEIVNNQKTISNLFLDGLNLALQMVFGMALLAVYHPLLLAFDLGLILGLLLIIFLLGSRALATSVDESRAKLEVGNWLHALAADSQEPRADEERANATLHADRLACEYLDQRKRHFRFLFAQISGFILLQIIANASVLAIGGWLVIIGQLTLGQLVAAEIVVSSLAAGVGKLGKYLENFYDLAASTDKLAHVLLNPNEEVSI
jgi:putative ABC transport system ATP-binding protein